MNKIFVASVLGTTALFAAVSTASAATFTTNDNKMTFETPNDNWHEESKEDTVISFSNGSDIVDVKEYSIQEMATKEDVPTPILKVDGFDEVYQVYYTVGDTLYTMTGYALKADDMQEVRAIIESMKLADHNKNTQKEETEKKETEKEEVSRTGNEMTLYYKSSNAVTVYEYTDGAWRDENGTEFWATTDGEWSNSNGELVYTYVPEVQSSDERTGNSIELYFAVGNSVGTVYEYQDGSWIDDAGVSYVDCGDYWESSQGQALYDHIPSVEEIQGMSSDSYDDSYADDTENE